MTTSKTRNDAARILFEQGWTFEEIESVLKDKSITLPVYREPNIKQVKKDNDWIEKVKRNTPVKPYTLEKPSDISCNYDYDNTR